MARTFRHFKVHVSALTHAKMRDVVADPELFSLWVKLGLVAIETWAARRDNSFYISDRQLVSLTCKRRADAAYRVMKRLVAVSTLSARYRDDTGSISDRYGDGIWEVTFTNLLSKQGFEVRTPKEPDPPIRTLRLSEEKESGGASAEPDAVVLGKARSLFIN